ncbi:MAG: AlkA N-terminal domain-containing protein [Gemmatimonadaceae bacterium]
MSVVLALDFSPPYHWDAMVAYLAARATPGVETVTRDRGGRYRRAVQLSGHCGHLEIGPLHRAAQASTLGVEISETLLPVADALLERIRRFLDLDADPQPIESHLGDDERLGPLVRRQRGLRVPGAFDGFELALRTVLGQQVSVRGATTLAGRLAERVGETLPIASLRDEGDRQPINRLAVTAERLAESSVATVAAIGLPRARAECVVALARAVAIGELPELRGDAPSRSHAEFERRFTELPGIGPWTATYVVMRALRSADAFPDSDLVLRRMTGGLSPARLRAVAERWRPWRAYAAQHLWTTAA